jgi:hypothetical protein
MRLSLVALIVVLLVAAAPASALQRPPLRATLAACESGPSADARFAVFTGSMPALAGTRRMWMRFDLMERRDGARRWRRLRAPAFGRWDKSKGTGAAGFIYTKRVEQLKQGARYRAVVRFRWLASGGRVQRERRRTTPVCRQPSQLPNLVYEGFEVLPGPDASTRRYRVTVANEGRTAAGPFRVGMTVDGESLVRDVPGLAATERTTVEIAGPRCERGRTLRIQLDVRGAVRESREADNRSIRLCDGR